MLIYSSYDFSLNTTYKLHVYSTQSNFDAFYSSASIHISLNTKTLATANKFMLSTAPKRINTPNIFLYISLSIII